MIYFIIIVNFLLAFKLYWDYRAKNVKKRIINHKQSAFIDGCLYVISALILFDGWTEPIGWVIMTIGFRWLAFDLLFNLLNRWKWNHYGESSSLDQFMKKVKRFSIPIKLTVITIGYLITRI